MSKTCTYYLSMQSPYAYFGHARLIAAAAKHDAQIELRPADFGKIFSVSGGVPLAKRTPQRQAYRLLELKRWSEFLGIPLNLQPKFFPVSADPSSKLVIATQLAHGTEAALTLTGQVMRALWADDKNISDPDTLIALANACGHDGVSLMKAADTASVQSELDRYTDEAIAANVFGAPWYVVDGEGYWGQDRLEFVERAFAK